MHKNNPEQVKAIKSSLQLYKQYPHFFSNIYKGLLPVLRAFTENKRLLFCGAELNSPTFVGDLMDYKIVNEKKTVWIEGIRYEIDLKEAKRLAVIQEF